MVDECGVDVLFHTYLIGADVVNGEIKSIEVVNESGKTRLEAKVFIDATGNADLCALAKVPTVLGRTSDNLCQPMTLIFYLSNVDVPLAYKEKADINNKYKELQDNKQKAKDEFVDMLFDSYVMNKLKNRLIRDGFVYQCKYC